jgi:superfamily II DNA/RNA helicase
LSELVSLLETPFALEKIDQNLISPELSKCLTRIGIKYLHLIQYQALLEGVTCNRSCLISTPSGSGKTLIAEIAILSHILEKRGKALYLVPLRALATEKAQYFKNMYGYLNISICHAVGDEEISLPDLERSDILILTFEKYDSFLRNLPENPWLLKTTIVIIDEVHLLGDSHRGSRLENCILRTYRFQNPPQMLYLSATIANPNILHNWFSYLEQKYRKSKMGIVLSQERPIPLKYNIRYSEHPNDDIEKICAKILSEQGQVLIFTNSRRDTEKLADFLSHSNNLQNIHLNNAQTSSADIVFQHILLRETISHGIAFHHAGLTTEERALIEKKFQAGNIRILCCTTTLSAGINTPTRAVILKGFHLFEKKKTDQPGLSEESAKFTKKIIDRNQFHQICGRAGRLGYDNVGLVFIIVGEREEIEFVENYYFSSSPEPLTPKYDSIQSILPSNEEYLSETVLTLIFERKNVRISDLNEYLQDSLIRFENGGRLKEPMNLRLNLGHTDMYNLLKFLSTRSQILQFQLYRWHFSFLEWIPEKCIKLSYSLTPKTISGQIDFKESVINSIGEIEFVYHSGVRCSCGFEYRVGSLDNKVPIDLEFCPHICSFFYLLCHIPSSFISKNIQFKNWVLNFKANTNSSVIFRWDIENFCYNSLYPPNIIDSLLNLDMIQIERNYSGENIIICSILGEISVRTYILPYQAYYLITQISRADHSPGLPRIVQILKTIKNLIEMEDQRENIPIIEIVNWWITENSIQQIFDKLRYSFPGYVIYLSDLQNLMEKIVRYFRFYKEYFFRIAYGKNTEYLEEIVEYNYRLYYGIKKDLIPWIPILRDITPVNLRMFVKNNIVSPNDLNKYSPEFLARISGLNLEKCREIQLIALKKMN